MIRVSFKVIIIVVLASLLYLGTFMIPFADEQLKYTGAFSDKIDQLVAHEAGSVILVGGSYSVFGLDVTLLEEMLNLPIVHLGLHGGIDLRFQLDTVLPHIREDDVIILALEYGYYTQSPDQSSSDLLRRMIASDPQNTLPYINTFGQWQTVMTYHSDYTINQLWRSFTNPSATNTACTTTYCRDSVSTSGSMRDEFHVANDDSRQKLNETLTRNLVYYSDTTLNQNVVRLLNNFTISADNEGATVYILLPSLPQPIVDASATNLLNFQTLITQEITIPTINEPYGVPTFLYYDTVFHLNHVGKRINTRYLGVLINHTLNPST